MDHIGGVEDRGNKWFGDLSPKDVPAPVYILGAVVIGGLVWASGVLNSDKLQSPQELKEAQSDAAAAINAAALKSFRESDKSDSVIISKDALELPEHAATINAAIQKRLAPESGHGLWSWLSTDKAECSPEFVTRFAAIKNNSAVELDGVKARYSMFDDQQVLELAKTGNVSVLIFQGQDLADFIGGTQLDGFLTKRNSYLAEQTVSVILPRSFVPEGQEGKDALEAIEGDRVNFHVEGEFAALTVDNESGAILELAYYPRG